jgi:hypothetical protein
MNEAGKITFRIKLEVSFAMRPPCGRRTRAIITTRDPCPRAA